jgi:hypothetical protein
MLLVLVKGGDAMSDRNQAVPVCVASVSLS